MLAIKECLIREGVLNLNSPNLPSSPSLSSLPPPSSHSHSRSSYPLYRNHFSFGSHLDIMAASTATAPKSVIDKSVNDLTSASATAKISCQIQQQHPSQLQLQHPQSELQEQQQQSLLKKQQNFKRYQGHHPHFHHHTAPAYYTDLHLRIHTPEVKDSLNENYQSVYRTPSKLVKDERQFPKSATATVAPPTIISKTDKDPSVEQEEVNPSSAPGGSFFRGGGCVHPSNRKQKADNPHPTTSSSNLENPVKGNSPQSTTTAHLGGVELPHTANADGSVVFACNNFKPRVTSELVQSAPIPVAPQQSPSTGRSSRNPQRFNNRRRAVRVRSESRPISALYDIICKEKGLDIDTSSTNDEDSSAQNSHDEKSSKPRRSHSRSQPKQSKTSNSNIMMSSGGLGNSSGGDHTQHLSPAGLQHKKTSSDKYSSPNTVYVNDLSDGDDDDDMNSLEGGCSRKNMRLRCSHKKPSLLSDVHQSKSSSLPPGLKGLSNLNLSIENHNNYQKQTQSQNHHHHHPSSKVSQESYKSLQASSASDNVLNANYSSSSATIPAASSSSATKVVEPEHLHLSNAPPMPVQIHEESAPSASGAGTSVASPKAERFSRKYRRSRDEKPRRHTDGAIELLASEQTKDDVVYRRQHHHEHVDNDDFVAGDQMQQRHHRHAHHSHQLFPHPHDLNGAGHDFHVLSNAANAKRFITRSQRATSAGINGCGDLQPSDSPSPASHSPIPEHFSPTSVAADDQVPQAYLQHQQQHHQREIPPSKSPTVTDKTENGFNPTVKDMTNNSGGGGSVKNSTTATITTINTNASNLKIQIPFNDESKTAILANPTTADNCGTSSTSTAAVATKNVECPKAVAAPPAISDKKKDEENRQQQRFTYPTSPKHQPATLPHHQLRLGPSYDNNSLSNKSPSGSESEHQQPMPSSSSSSSLINHSTKLVPSVSVSVKQNLNEMHCTASRSNSIRSNASSPKSPKHKAHSVECSVIVPSSPKAAQRQSTATTADNFEDDMDDDFMEINDLPLDGAMHRPRSSTMHNETNERTKSGSSCLGQSNEFSLELSPVHRSRNLDHSPRPNEDRDKSSKRKSNLNRSLNEEAIPDSDEAALRRRRRRELGMARALVPNDDPALKELLSSPLRGQPTSPSKPAIRNDLSYHMEMARRGLDLATTSSNLKSSPRRAQTASPKHVKAAAYPPSTNKPQAPPRVTRRCDTVAIGELRKQRTDEVNRKFNERTRSDLAEIIKIVEIANECPESSANPIADLTKTMNRFRASQEREGSEENHSSSSTGKHATFHQEECIYYEPDPVEHSGPPTNEVKNRSKAGGILRSQRMLKAKSIERESSFEPTKLSPILRRKSTDDPLYSISQTPNHIVSILKKKDHLSAGESSSASSNASPVTFSSNVMDTPSNHKRAGILKKRSSLDESRYYSRSHSPDERSIFIKSARRNSLEETAANGNNLACSLSQGPQGILKQSSYDSFKSDSCPSAGGAAGGSGTESQHPHSILKKKDSTSTPSDGNQHVAKHVSISQAVILAAAELSANDAGENALPDELSYTPSNEEYDIKPILKLETSNNDDTVKPPKPILKKKSSGDSDEHEIKPILKTSRKSSREEFEFDPFSESDNQEPLVKPILKTDSPSKRRSLGAIDADHHTRERDASSPLLLKSRTRSLERQDQTPVLDLGAALNAIATSQANTNELVATLTSTTPGGVNISVSDRIRTMEKFLNNPAGNNTSSITNTSWESPLQNDSNVSLGTAAAGGAVNMKILKPSVIRRDLYKDRYKTQPVTNDEMNFFKNNDSSTLYTSPSGSAFKPAKSLEGLGFVNITAHGNQSPNASPSAFALTRSFTQPLYSLSHCLNSPPQSSSSFKTGVTRKTANRSSSHQLNDSTANRTLSFTGDSDLSGDSHSEQRIFDMSSLEADVDMIENQEPKTQSNPDSSNASYTATGGGIVRTNSVRARANMFQQLQEKTNSGTNLNREERTSPRRVPRRLSPSPSPLDASSDEPRTPNNPTLHPDEEIEPSSLPLSERLRFFSSLSESHNRNSGSFTRSPPANSIERCSSLSSYGNYFMPSTPRSSTSQSSASVTPTPMECNQLPPIFIDSPMILKRDQCNGKVTASVQNASIHHQHDMGNHSSIQDFSDSREAIKADIVKTSPFLQISKPVNAHLKVAETTPTSTLTPTMKRIKLKTIGKLMLPQTFLNNDRNNNTHSKEISLTEQSSSENDSSQPPKKIGKIKSPFIENCNQMHQNKGQASAKCIKLEQRSHPLALASLENSAEHHVNTSNSNKFFNNSSSTLTNGHHHHHNPEDSNTDSGKENVDTSSTSAAESVTQTTPVVEIRRKFTRKNTNTQSLNTSVPRQQLPPRSASLNGPHSSSPQIDDKYAKFFGIATAISGHDKTNSAHRSKLMPPPLPKQPPPKLTAETRARQEFLPQIRLNPSEAPPSMKFNRFSASTTSRMSCIIKLLKAYEDIVVTERELKQAPKEFENLLHNESIRAQQTVELEKIFSSIV